MIDLNMDGIPDGAEVTHTIKRADDNGQATMTQSKWVHRGNQAINAQGIDAAMRVAGGGQDMPDVRRMMEPAPQGRNPADMMQDDRRPVLEMRREYIGDNSRRGVTGQQIGMEQLAVSRGMSPLNRDTGARRTAMTIMGMRNDYANTMTDQRQQDANRGAAMMANQNQFVQAPAIRAILEGQANQGVAQIQGAAQVATMQDQTKGAAQVAQMQGQTQRDVAGIQGQAQRDVAQAEAGRPQFSPSGKSFIQGGQVLASPVAEPPDSGIQVGDRMGDAVVTGFDSAGRPKGYVPQEKPAMKQLTPVEKGYHTKKRLTIQNELAKLDKLEAGGNKNWGIDGWGREENTYAQQRARLMADLAGSEAVLEGESQRVQQGQQGRVQAPRDLTPDQIKKKILESNPGTTENDPEIQALLKQYGVVTK